MRRLCPVIIFSLIVTLLTGCSTGFDKNNNLSTVSNKDTNASSKIKDRNKAENNNDVRNSNNKNDTKDTNEIKDTDENTPSIEPTNYRNLSMINDSIGWIIRNNRILRTEDGWQNCKDVTPYKKVENVSYDEEPPVAAYFYNENIAWVSIGSYTEDKQLYIYHTTNGGDTWDKTLLSVKEPWENEGKQYISFINPKEGYLLATSGPALGMMNKSIYKTIDGGSTWRRLGDISHEISSYPTGINFSNSVNGWIASSNHGEDFIPVFKTENCGENWSKEDLPTPSNLKDGYYTNGYSPIFFKDSSENGVLPIEFVKDGEKFIIPYVTSDGGSTWAIPKNYTNYNYSVYDFMDKTQWWALDKKDNKLFMTDDGGQTWKLIYENINFKDIKFFQFVNNKLGFAISNDTFVKTSDGGVTWNNIKIILDNNNHEALNDKVQNINYLNSSKEINSPAFHLEDVSIHGKPLTEQTFKEINDEFGQYTDIKYYKTPVPATPNEFNYWALVIYKEGEFLFSINENETINDECKVNKFYIKGDKYYLNCGLKVGMATKEVIDKFKNAQEFNIEDKEYDVQGNVLNNHMPINHYTGYENGIYIWGSVTDEENEKYELGGMTRLLGIVLLIKDGKVDGIIMDYPTAN